MMNKLRCGGLLLLGLAAPVWAESEALMTLLRALHENGTIDTATYERVQQAAQADAQAAGAQGADLSRIESEQIAQRVMVEERMAAMSKPEVKGKPDVRLGGRPDDGRSKLVCYASGPFYGQLCEGNECG